MKSLLTLSAFIVGFSLFSSTSEAGRWRHGGHRSSHGGHGAYHGGHGYYGGHGVYNGGHGYYGGQGLYHGGHGYYGGHHGGLHIGVGRVHFGHH